jgi:cell division protease FtsH
MDEINQVLRGEKVVRDDTGGAGPGSDRRRRASVPTSSGQNPGQNPGTSPGANPEPQPGV